MSNETLLRLTKASRIFHAGDQEVRALDEVSLTIKTGEFVAIMGQSGSGKSTMMNVLGCLDNPTSGSYKIRGQEVSSLSPDQLSALRLKTFGFVFQRYQLLPNYTALQNVAMPAMYSGIVDEQRFRRAEELLIQLELGGRIDHRPSELSGGQQQRVSIARALINDAEVILADEPTGALDSESSKHVLELLQKLHQETGATVILITHDQEVADYAERIVHMKDGKIISDSSSESEPVSDSPSGPIVPFPRIGMLSSMGLAMNGLRSNLFRTMLTLLGIIIGVAAVVSMMAIGHGGKQQVLDRIESMGTNLLQVRPGGRNIRASGDIATLVMGDAEAIAELPGVEAVAPERDTRTTMRRSAYDYSGRIRGVTPEYFYVRDWQLSQGVFLDESDVDSFASVMVIGATVADELFPDGVNPLGQFVLIGGTAYQIIGVLKAKGASAGGNDNDDEGYVPISTAQLRFFGSNYLTNMTIKVAATDQLGSLEEQIRQLLVSRHGTEDFQVRNTASLVEAVTETSDTLTWLLAAVAAISLLVGGIGVMNIMLVNVTERRREIGLRIATGAKPGDILRQFNIEALMICLIGGVIGVLLGVFVSLSLQALDVPIQLSIYPALLAFTTSLLVGWVFGYAPAHKAASLNPILALAEE